MQPDTNEQNAGRADPGRSWLYCENCDWARTVRSATSASAFALAEEDARTHAALTTYDDDPHCVHAINPDTGDIVVHD
ncbi:hypothetical protein ACFPYI_04985 [Halomarina salina]|uniref:Uncharacterized protein n=1 Tax=Halomarina salina TaxID=1872699 RepID=A0ABD5RK19_9EURY|nr:hypothetical protein [Halomarina salina]